MLSSNKELYFMVDAIKLKLSNECCHVKLQYSL